MADRLPLDANVLGYWGFDEANETDVALDESSLGIPLSVLNSPSVVPGRVGNARSFNGASTYGIPVAPPPLYQVRGEMTLNLWVMFSSVNPGGSELRTILSADAAGGTDDENRLYGLFVDKDGRLVYKHHAGAASEVICKTFPGLLKTGRPYCIQMTRSGSPNQTIKFYIDNREVPIPDITVGGIPSAFPVPPPFDGDNSVLQFGMSDKEADDAFWHGWIDEVSIHTVVRNSAYLSAAYLRAVLPDASAKITVSNSIKMIASSNMLNGVRWWTYERDQSLYVVREFPFGVFSPEVQLTTTTATIPGGTTLPALIYEPDSDTLLVVFVSAGRVYKITASADDAPSTQNMPFTADLPLIIKLIDLADSVRLGMGTHSQTQKEPGLFTYPVAPVIHFSYTPDFGIAIPVTEGAYGAAVYRKMGGYDVLLGTTTTLLPDGYYHYPITSREFGAVYFVIPLDQKGAEGTNASNAIKDGLGGFVGVDGNPDYWKIGTDGDLSDGAKLGGGSSVGDELGYQVSFVNRGVIKIPLTDACELGQGSGNPNPTRDVSYVNRGVVKFSLYDAHSSNNLGMGGSNWASVVKGNLFFN